MEELEIGQAVELMGVENAGLDITGTRGTVKSIQHGLVSGRLMAATQGGQCVAGKPEDIARHAGGGCEQFCDDENRAGLIWNAAFLLHALFKRPLFRFVLGVLVARIARTRLARCGIWPRVLRLLESVVLGTAPGS